jgi:TRAP-type uncharacterized transport system fused permease subunit
MSIPFGKYCLSNPFVFSLLPFMFFYSPSLLLQGGDWLRIAHYAATAIIDVYLLAGALQRWFLGPMALLPRLLLLTGLVLLVAGGLMTDLLGVAPAGAVAAWQLRARRIARPRHA